MSVLRFHILQRSGWVGNSHQRPVHNKKEAVQPLVLATVEVNQQAIKIQEADWHRAGLLMPMSVRELMRRRESEVS